MTNFSLERMLRDEGIALTRVGVGDRFIFEEMQRSGAPLGGEPSGHVIFPDFKLSGDGLLTTLKVAEAIATDRASFEDLTRDWVEAPQLLKNIRVREKSAARRRCRRFRRRWRRSIMNLQGSRASSGAIFRN